MFDDHLVWWFTTGFALEGKFDCILSTGNPKYYLVYISRYHFQNYITDLQLRTTNLDYAVMTGITVT